MLEGESELPIENLPHIYQVKFIVVGDSGVGKSNIILRFTHNEFRELTATLGVAYDKKQLKYNNKEYLIQVWDTAGQENFKSVTRGYYKGSAVALIVYDITDEVSFTNVEKWISDCKDNAPNSALLVLIGNKSDLEEKRVISKDKGKNLAEENDMIFFETSALNGNGIENAFKKCIEAVDKKIRNGDYNLSNLNEMNKYGIKKIEIDNENNNERIIDKKSLSIGKQKKKDDPCC